MTTLLDPRLQHQKRLEEIQSYIDYADKVLYTIRKPLSDEHVVGCHCDVCDWVDDYEYEQSRLHPAVEPNYCQE